jgi:transposase
MNTKQLLKDVLGLQYGWRIGHIEKDDTARTVTVEIRYRKNMRLYCPLCQKRATGIHDHHERTWRHKDLGDYKTILRASVPRVKCKSCNSVNLVAVPWADKMMRITEPFQRQLVAGLIKMTVKDVCNTYAVSWYTVNKALTTTIADLRKKKRYDWVTVIGLDEIAIRKGHKYLTIVYDLTAGEVIWIGRDRTCETLKEFIVWFGEERFKTLDSICCDMWDPYLKAIKEYRGEMGIVFDKFHIKQHLNDAVDSVRKIEHRALTAEGVDVLTKTKYIWLKNPANLTERQEVTFQELRHQHLKVFRAYQLKELFNFFWLYRSQCWAEKFFKSWYFSATHSRLTPMIKTAKMLKSYWYGIISYITTPLTNARSEGMNCKIRVFTKRAYGYKTVQMLTNMIFLGCGGLDLPPLTSN